MKKTNIKPQGLVQKANKRVQKAEKKECVRQTHCQYYTEELKQVPVWTFCNQSNRYQFEYRLERILSLQTRLVTEFFPKTAVLTRKKKNQKNAHRRTKLEQQTRT